MFSIDFKRLDDSHFIHLKNRIKYIGEYILIDDLYKYDRATIIPTFSNNDNITFYKSNMISIETDDCKVYCGNPQISIFYKDPKYRYFIYEMICRCNKSKIRNDKNKRFSITYNIPEYEFNSLYLENEISNDLFFIVDSMLKSLIRYCKKYDLKLFKYKDLLEVIIERRYYIKDPIHMILVDRIITLINFINVKGNEKINVEDMNSFACIRKRLPDFSYLTI